MSYTEIDPTKVSTRVRQLEELHREITAVQRTLGEVVGRQGPGRWSDVGPVQGFVSEYTANLERVQLNMQVVAAAVQNAAANLQASAAALLEQDQATADRLTALLTRNDATAPATTAATVPAASRQFGRS